jgi:hypothetical protein
LDARQGLAKGEEDVEIDKMIRDVLRQRCDHVFCVEVGLFHSGDVVVLTW